MRRENKVIEKAILVSVMISGGWLKKSKCFLTFEK